MTLNDAHGLLQNLISTPMIDGLPLVEEKKKVQKLSQVNQERPFEFTMNTSTWFKKCFNQDFIFCKYMLPSEYQLFISMSLFWARLSFGLKRCPAFPASFSRFIWFTSMALGDFSLCMSSGRNSPLFRYRWLTYMKLWSSHYTFVEFLFFIAEIILFLVKKKRNYFQFNENALQIQISVRTG